MVRPLRIEKRQHLTRADLEKRADEVASLLKTLSHPVRLMLVCTLVEGEFSVGALEEQTGVGQPTLSQQLGVLRDAEIVATRREAKQIFYRLTNAKAAQLVGALHTIFCAEEKRA